MNFEADGSSEIKKVQVSEFSNSRKELSVYFLWTFLNYPCRFLF